MLQLLVNHLKDWSLPTKPMSDKGPNGNMTHRNTPNEDMPHGDATYGNMTYGNMPNGNVPNKDMTHGSTTHTNVTQGNVTYSNAPSKDATTPHEAPRNCTPTTVGVWYYIMPSLPAQTNTHARTPANPNNNVQDNTTDNNMPNVTDDGVTDDNVPNEWPKEPHTHCSGCVVLYKEPHTLLQQCKKSSILNPTQTPNTKPTKQNQTLTTPAVAGVWYSQATIVQEEQPVAALLGCMGAPGAPGLLDWPPQLNCRGPWGPPGSDI
ncbi:hypothetical protein BS47DRAFT_1359393 [Hydnum rufescens UP504]|uniref:Uncharacterized protein n=1 Tax=Hydnum rufescens UP504 TaxID=1448309 RepID=A0A9P6DWW6_9AGAM|nr:hypothetical protein BS47DRAFT_1359393 [Hydnum rufescens UP504]